MEYLFILSRVLFGGFFVNAAYNHFKNHTMLAGYATSKGVPFPLLAVLGTGVLCLFGGAGIILGVYVKWAVLAIVVFLLPTSFMMHGFWSMTDPAARASNKDSFIRNMTLIGGALAYLFIAEPWMWSLF